MGQTHEAVAHAWAHGVRSHGKGHALFFEGDTIYSYGHHFPIARIVDRALASEEGSLPFVAFATRTAPSISTAQHMAIVKSAIPSGWPIGRVPDPTAPIAAQSQAIRAWYLEEIGDAVGKAKRARTNGDHWLDRAATLRAEGNYLANYWRLGWRLPGIEHVGVDLAEIRERASAKAAKEAEAQRRKLADRVRAWRRGGAESVSGHPDTLLRVRGKYVETSRGVSFPISDAKRAWPVIRRCRKEGQGIETVPHEPQVMLGPYGIDKIDHHGNVTAGCHHVKWEEIARLARQLKLRGATA